MIKNQKFNQQDWNRFVLANNGSFLQSYQWHQFQNEIKHPAWLIQAAGSQAVVLRYDLAMGQNYLYIPRGPILEPSADISDLISQLKELAKKQKSIFIKIEPANDLNLTKYGFQKSIKEWQPSQTIILDLDKPEQELLSALHQKTRYNLKIAIKKGVQIMISDSQTDLEQFVELLKKTSQRDNFYLHPKDFYLKMMEILGKDDILKIYLAKYQDKIIAANLICFFNQTAYYLHGASDYNYRQLMAPYLLQWQAVKDAQAKGFKRYDFWGIDEQKWPGVTRFKKGFGGQVVEYPGAFDLVLKPVWYQIYNLVRSAR